MILLIFTNLKSDTYNSILVIIGWLIKIVYYKLVKVTIDASGLAEAIFDMRIKYYGMPNSIMNN